MEDNTEQSQPEVEASELMAKKSGGNNPQVIAGAILLAGIIIAGAILLKDSGSSAGSPLATGGTATETTGPAKVTSQDRIIGNPKAKVAVIVYEDFQCPFCDRFEKDSEQIIRNQYIPSGDVALVYRDYAFLGPESTRAAEAARCAGDQGKFWEYHDYLFDHQQGENQGAFADPKLKTFASALGLNTADFNSCLDSQKYAQAVKDSTAEGTTAGVRGTPKGFILKNGKVVDTIDGAIQSAQTIQKLDAALK